MKSTLNNTCLVSVLHIISVHLAVSFIVVPSSFSWNNVHSASSASFFSLSIPLVLLHYSILIEKLTNICFINQSVENFAWYKDWLWILEYSLMNMNWRSVSLLSSPMSAIKYLWFNFIPRNSHGTMCHLLRIWIKNSWMCVLHIRSHTQFSTTTWHNYEYLCDISARNVV